MHKVIVCLVIAFVLLGLALVMLSKQLEQPVSAPQSRESQRPSSLTLPELPELKGGIQDQKKQAVVQSPASILPPLPDSLQSQEDSKPADRPEIVSGTIESAQSHQQEDDTAQSKPEAKPELMPESSPDPKPTAKTELPKHTPKLAAKSEQRPRLSAKSEATKPILPIKNSHILLYSRHKGATIRISGSDDIHYKQMIFSQPDRVVIDLIGVWDVKSEPIPKNLVVTNIRVGRFPKKTRIVLDLPTTPRQTKFILSKDHRQLDVRVDQ